MLLWGSTGSQREDCLVEASQQAAQCVCPHHRTIVIWSRPAARVAVVGDSNVSIVRVAIIPIFKALKWRRGHGRLLSRRHRRLIHTAAPATGRLGTTPRSTTTACLLLWREDGGGGCCCRPMQYWCITCSWVYIDTIVVPWVLTNSWVAAYAAPKFAIDLPYNATVSSSLTAAIQ
jgi:hypothetical protein